jgi:hypothetical protein
MTPDPAGAVVADPGNPQSLNRYSYVLNNPLNLIDPLGLDGEELVVWDDGSAKDFVTDTVEGGCDDDCFFFFLPGGGGGGGAATPAPQNPCSVSQRAVLLGNGLLNVAAAGLKFATAVGVEVGTGGIGTPLALYGVFTGSGNLTAGILQTVGAFSSNPIQYQQAAANISAVTSVSGLTKLLTTGGNVQAAASASRIEGFASFGLRGGMTGSANPVSATGQAVNAVKQAGVTVGCH